MGGVALSVVGMVIYFSAVTDFTSSTSLDSYLNKLLWGTIIMGVGGVATPIGGLMWYFGARGIQLWEMKKVEISLQVRGPNLARGQKLGEISLAWSC